MKFKNEVIKKDKIEIIQINVGNKCNQSCTHCHIKASVNGDKNMNYITANKIIEKLINSNVGNIELTGGAPELNECTELFIKKLSAHNKTIAIRTNLAILTEDKYKKYIKLYKDNKVNLIGSLPSLSERLTDKQRGEGVFRRTIDAIRVLNKEGFSIKNNLTLDLVYNSPGENIPKSQCELEKDYKKILKEKYSVIFNNLITIINAPIGNFKTYLKENNKLESYLNLLENKYNTDTLDHLMCKRIISVDYNGDVYDCDFNLATNKQIEELKDKKIWEIDLDKINTEVTMSDYCYACMAGTGSSCHGSLVKDNVKEYYGDALSKTEDLKTSACCTTEIIPGKIKDALKLVNDEIKMKYYGCGSPIPENIENLKCLDVGCGTGRDVYVMSKLVGKNGFVYGIDMTDKQIEVARKYEEEQKDKFGYKSSNVKFIHDYIENLTSNIKNDSIDVVTSNCVINLIEDKRKVMQDIYNILRVGGEMYFSDVYSDRRNTKEIITNPILYGECLGGALYYRDFEDIANSVGFKDLRIMKSRKIGINNPEIEALVGNTNFYSITFRLFKINNLDNNCEDCGQLATYIGNDDKFVLDQDHEFIKNEPKTICANTARILMYSRFNRHFVIDGSFENHIGAFDCNCEIDLNKESAGSCC